MRYLTFPYAILFVKLLMLISLLHPNAYVFGAREAFPDLDELGDEIVNSNRLVRMYPKFEVIPPPDTAGELITDPSGTPTNILFKDADQHPVRNVSIIYSHTTDRVKRLVFRDVESDGTLTEVGSVDITYTLQGLPNTYTIKTTDKSRQKIHIHYNLRKQTRSITIKRSWLDKKSKINIHRKFWSGHVKDIVVRRVA
jgi:hypothetical protein